MPRKFKTANYEATLDQKVSLREVLPPNHLARFVVDISSQLNLRSIYGRYATQGGEPFAPEILLGLLFYGYATGIFSSRKIEKATYESIPLRFIAGGLDPDHDTIANFRKTFLAELKELFVQILLLAQAVGVLKLGNLSLDGSKIQADASKSKAVSYKRLIELEAQLRQEVHQLFDLAEQGEIRLPDGLSLPDEIALRQERLANLAQAKAVLEARAQERYEAEKAEYEAKLGTREKKAAQTKRKRGGRKPKPPQPGPRPKDQYNFTDPDSRIMKNSTNAGFDQHYNAQAAVDQASMLIVAPALSNHANDKGAAEPTLAALDPALGQAAGVAMDNGYFSQATLEACAKHGWRLILLPVGSPITAVGAAFSPTCRNHRPRRPAPLSKWLTSCGRRLARPFTACGNVQLNRSSALSKKSWASASFPYAASIQPRANGGWSAWLSISNGCIPCGRPKVSFRLPAARNKQGYWAKVACHQAD